ncbi:MAG: hypothetical protein AVDCRST_MAG10-3544 [uncultured Acidimicrobiales bacterium]|uniref:OmpR/PhoB-type domain-containing protein n=1 Tax=uncultured Acidimicrobiales bacterium TaxID=310071 RepID=A0A6J4JE70_9ACTN|nr:MAG: hypothetical protein AVDCRST_MAG10-3544 [uncultured Acidimicrobiales bacterium]
MVEFAILGPLDVLVGNEHVHVRPGLPRVLLTSLVLRAGDVVSVDTLIDNLWGEELPANPLNALQTQISYLRKVLAAAGAATGGCRVEVLERVSGGYRLRATADEVDVRRFERLVAEARRLLDSGTAPALAAAVDRFDAALSLWRGDALADAVDREFARAEATRLDELRLGAIEARVDALLALGRHQDATEELVKLVRDHPLRERFYEQLIVAQYRSGRQAEGLRTFESARRLLADELGIDPGPSLRSLESAVLSHDPKLGWTPPPGHDGGPVLATVDAAFARPAARALPALLSDFIGRDDELKRLEELLVRRRLLTITGPGGAGKSRLALELAHRHPAGRSAWLVDLSSVRDGEDVPLAIAATLGVPTPPGQDPVDLIGRALSDHEGLVLLDTCEHVVDSVAGAVSAILRRCPRMAVLATSRRPLAITGEVAWPLPPLSVPPAEATDPAAIARYPAVQLFCVRATEVRPGFSLDAGNASHVAAICAALDGLPLAIELAAAQVDVLTPGTIRARLVDRFRLLVGGGRDAAARQQTLRATFDWSLALLDPPEREVFAMLGAFSGSFDLDATVAVVGDEYPEALRLVTNLVRQSMVVATGDDRFRLLDSFREYANELLAASGSCDAVAARHAQWFTTLAEDADVKVRSDEQDVWLRRLHGELPNFRRALEWAFDRDPQLGARLATALSWFWTLEGMLIEACRWLDRAVATPNLPPRLRSKALTASGYLAAPLGRLDYARDACDEAAAIAAEEGDDWAVGNALITAGVARWGLDDFDRAIDAHTEAIARFAEVGNEWGMSVARALLARTAVDRGDPEAPALLHAAATGAKATGDRHILALVAEQQARLALRLGDVRGAVAAASECLALHESIGSPEGTAAALHVLGMARRAAGENDLAGSVHLRALELAVSIGHAGATAEALEDLAVLAFEAGDRQRAAHLLTIASRERHETGIPVRRADRHRLEALLEAVPIGELQGEERAADVLGLLLHAGR